MVSHDGKPYVWLEAAEHAGVSLTDVDKALIKKVIGVIHNGNLDVSPNTVLVCSQKEAQDLSKAADQMKNMKSKHLQSGGTIAEAFVTNFTFSPEVVETYLADPKAAVTSLPTPITIGGKAVFLALTWREDSMWLSAVGSHSGACEPLCIQLRSVSPALTMRKEFKLPVPAAEPILFLNFAKRGVRKETQGTGLCCTMQGRKAFANNMKAGILCTGLACDLETSAGGTGRKSYAITLQLDTPGWARRNIPA